MKKCPKRIWNWKWAELHANTFHQNSSIESVSTVKQRGDVCCVLCAVCCVLCAVCAVCCAVCCAVRKNVRYLLHFSKRPFHIFSTTRIIHNIFTALIWTDDLVIFNRLTRADMERILEINLKDVKKILTRDVFVCMCACVCVCVCVCVCSSPSHFHIIYHTTHCTQCTHYIQFTYYILTAHFTPT